MKIVVRREIFTCDVFTEISLQVTGYRVSLKTERDRRKRDRQFHWTLGK